MRPFLESLPYEEGSSICLLDRQLEGGIPFQWHHHPEYELTLTLNSRGQRFIGDHVGEYGPGDLVLVGPNQPHTWVSRRAVDRAQPHAAKVIWFHPDWARAIGGGFAEYRALGGLFARAERGLAFSHGASEAVLQGIGAVFAADVADRMAALLQVLRILAEDRGAGQLASQMPPETAKGRGRIDRVLSHIHVEYHRAVALRELAEIAALSTSGLHRQFRAQTGQTISGYVAQLRVGEACARLSGGRAPIAHIAGEVGYPSLANFNRQFLRLKGMTPRAYRAHFQAG